LRSGIPIDDTLSYFSQILDGVEAAHLQKVVHRDLKPENILYDKDKNLFSIADFGIAQFQEEELFTAIETSNGTRLANFQYAAPEQRSRGQSVDHHADIFALGLILNEMFTNQVPQGTSYKTIGSVSKNHLYLDELVSDMLKQSPDERPASIEVVKRELIRRNNEFITLQKISELRDTVVPTSDIDDPIVLDPIRLVGFDWDRNLLKLILNQPVTEKWLNALYNMGSHTSIVGKEPQVFKFRSNEATIPAEERDVQRIIDFFKDWLPKANKVYERNLKLEQQELEKKKRREIEQEKTIQETRQRILRNTKI
jgi:serine/threonine protein kinase